MKRNKVTKLLGEPDDITNEGLYYCLGYSYTGINTGSLTLIISKDTVISIKVLQG